MSSQLPVAAVTSLLGVVLTRFLPRFWQGELRRSQLESETRVKRLEAIEKAITVVGKAKSELGIEVSTQELENELGRILHQFADPVVLSCEALEDWANEPLVGRLLRTPRFSMPVKEARYVRREHKFSVVTLFMLLLYTVMMGLESTLDSHQAGKALPCIFLYGSLYCVTRVTILQDAKLALKAVRAMLKSTTEVEKSSSRGCRTPYLT
jgi:hypothetical protein